jgi:phosphoribosylaminoimidazolecarboxamide formyltransferase/IMP cyclohydrolase
VFDKTGVVDFARGLAALKVEIISTGGTHRLLAANNIPVREVQLTGFPEILMVGSRRSIHALRRPLAIRENAQHPARSPNTRS